MGSWRHPVPDTQTSTVQDWPSSHEISGPSTQIPALQWSGSVQGSPLVHSVPSGAGVPLHTPLLQASLDVHWLPSVHAVPFGATTPTHAPATHWSLRVQAF